MAGYDTEIRVATKVDTSQMQRLQIQIDKAVNKVDALKKKSEELKTAKVPTEEYARLSAQVKEAENQLARMVSKQKYLSDMGKEGTMQFKSMQEKIAAAESGLSSMRSEVQKLVDTGKDFKLAASREEINGTANELAAAESELRMLVTKQQELNGKTSIFKTTLKKIPEDLKKIGALAANIFSKITNHVKKATTPVGVFATRIKGIALSLLVFNQIIKGINVMVSGIKEGFKNLVQYSEEYNRSISSLQSANAQLKNSFAAAFAPIVQMVIPYLVQLISYITSAVNVIAQLIALLAGKSTWTRATAVQKNYAKSLSGTASAAKKVAGALAGFDELDVLNKNKTDDTGGSGGVDPGNMFEEAPIDNRLKDLWKWLRSMWDKADFYDLGKMLGDKLAEALAKIPWDKIKAQARKLAHSLATLINGFIEGEFDGIGVGWWIGHTLAEGLNTAFEFLNEFVHTLKWTKIGDFIADSINGFTQSIEWNVIEDTLVGGAERLASMLNNIVRRTNWESLAEMVSNGINIMVKAIYRFFDTIDWNKAGVKIGGFLKDAFEGIDFEKLGRTIGIVVQSAIDFFKGLISHWNMNEVIGAIEDLFKGIFEEADWKAVALICVGLITAELIKSFTTMAFAGVGAALEKAIGEAVVNAFVSVGGIGGILTTDIGTIVGAGSAAEIGLAVGTAIVGGIIAAIGGFHLGKEIGKAITGDDGTYDSFKWGGEDGFFSTITDDLGTTLKAIEDMMTDFENNPVIATLANIVAGPLVSAFVTYDTYADKVGEKLYELVDKFNEFKDNIPVYLEEMKENIATTLVSVWEEDIMPWFTAEKWYELKEGIQEGFSQIWDEICDWWSNTALVTWWEEHISPWFTTEKWSALADGIKTGISTKWNELVTWWQINIVAWWNNHVAPWFTVEKWKTLGENMKNGIYSGFKGLTNKVIDVLNSVIEALENMLNEAIAGINSFLTMLGNSKLGEMIGFDFTLGSASFGRIPHLASGAVIRGGDPFMAVLGDQRAGQTNVEAPLSTIEDAVRNVMDENTYSGGGDMTINLNYDGETFARLFLPDFFSEMHRQGYDLDFDPE